MRQLLTFLGAFVLCTASANAANPVVVIKTSMGNIKVELFEDKAPETVKNFLKYTDEKFYDGTVFHRVIGKPNSSSDFMIQGGGFESGMKEKKTRDPIKNESANNLANERGTLAMAPLPIQTARRRSFSSISRTTVSSIGRMLAIKWATVCSAKFWREWMWSTRSKLSKCILVADIRMFRSKML